MWKVQVISLFIYNSILRFLKKVPKGLLQFQVHLVPEVALCSKTLSHFRRTKSERLILKSCTCKHYINWNCSESEVHSLTIYIPISSFKGYLIGIVENSTKNTDSTSFFNFFLQNYKIGILVEKSSNLQLISLFIFKIMTVIWKQ